MENKTSVVLIVSLLFIFIMVVSFGGQKAKWKGKVEEKGGIIVVKNPKEPMYREDVFSLEESQALHHRRR